VSKLDFAYGLNALKSIVDRHSFGGNKEMEAVTCLIDFLGEASDAYIAYRMAHPAKPEVDPKG